MVKNGKKWLKMVKKGKNGKMVKKGKNGKMFTKIKW